MPAPSHGQAGLPSPGKARHCLLEGRQAGALGDPLLEMCVTCMLDLGVLQTNLISSGHGHVARWGWISRFPDPGPSNMARLSQDSAQEWKPLPCGRESSRGHRGQASWVQHSIWECWKWLLFTPHETFLFPQMARYCAGLCQHRLYEIFFFLQRIDFRELSN